MKSEAEFKTAFKRSVKAQGGFALSLAAPMLPGIPDLYVIMQGYAPLLLEAKWFKELDKESSRKIPYTPLQKGYLKAICNVADYTAMGLLGWKQNNDYYCALVHPDREYFTPSEVYRYSVVAKKRIFNIEELFSLQLIPEILVRIE
jgi:hypothetical protein